MLVLVLIGDAVATAAFLICPFLAGLAGLPVFCCVRQQAIRLHVGLSRTDTPSLFRYYFFFQI
jgi:hypothetical protein